ncbi:Serotonin N-acetyltransferase [Colletotrichum sidae]|nr:Serotonin N-acetyltransferase [Colletotrichum spinosum]TDZ65143.1 Serotonin N-acetyltransferase [Colletotrichum trifolii]TEA20841.1 Serotonin N-acetyltransferase [Colletotrichum sidae]
MSKQPPSKVEVDELSDCAIDDSDDCDDTYAEQHKSMYEQKQKRRPSGPLRVQEIVPFHFSPLVQPLTNSSVDSCVALENAAFPNPDHRATREKFEYRLSTCSDICSGIFCSIVPGEAKDFTLETLPVAHCVETGRRNGAVLALCAHAVATLGNGPVVTDADMCYPLNWRDQESSKSSGLGHQFAGRTVCLHSFAVAPKLQGCGLGKLMMKTFLQQIHYSGVADRVALICQDYLVSYYKQFGFRHLGESKASFAGGGWNDMVVDLPGPREKEVEEARSAERLKSLAAQNRAFLESQAESQIVDGSFQD